MTTITIALNDPLNAALDVRIEAMGFCSKEDYIRTLIESDCAFSELDGALAARLEGPFVALNLDWKDRVRQATKAQV